MLARESLDRKYQVQTVEALNSMATNLGQAGMYCHYVAKSGDPGGNDVATIGAGPYTMPVTVKGSNGVKDIAVFHGALPIPSTTDFYTKSGNDITFTGATGLGANFTPTERLTFIFYVQGA